MLNAVRLVLTATALLAAFPASAQTPAFDPRAWHGQHAGKPTQVLTIGSAHLSELPLLITEQIAAPLIDKMAAFKPDIITVEGISGEQCDELRRYPARYPEMFDTYCRGVEEAAAATGLDIPAAMAAAEKVLAAWSAAPSVAPTPVQRRQLATLFLASGDRASAQVQWQRLPLAERRLGDGVNEALHKILTRNGATANETFTLAVPLAVRMGLERVYLVDDHTADSVQAQAGPGFGPALQAIWASSKFPESAQYDARSKALKDGAGLLDFYRYLNQPKIQRAFITGDYHWAMNTPSPQLYGRQYLAWFEVRNLRMVANIRAAFGNHPGARVLNVVGASHKPFYDAYLGMMSDVRLADAEKVLK